MTLTTAHMSISLDGFVAGPGQTFEDPIGRRGLDLHQWHFEPTSPVTRSTPAGPRSCCGRAVPTSWAATCSGQCAGPGRRTTGSWRGWWGEEPPYHAPVFVLTSYEHEPIEMEGGTTFHFVTEGMARALELAREAGDGDVDIAGGASAVRQALALGELDEPSLDIIAVLLGEGERIFDGTVDAALEIVEAEHSPWATHVRYRVVR